MFMLRSYFLITTFVVSTGCSITATGPIFQDARAPSKECALVYIYRPYSKTYRDANAKFYINDENVAALSNKGYTAFYLPDGEHLLKQKWSALTFVNKETVLPLNIIGGETHFFRLTASHTYQHNNYRPSTLISWTLTHTDAAIGKSEIAMQHFQEPLNDSLLKLGSRKCK